MLKFNKTKFSADPQPATGNESVTETQPAPLPATPEQPDGLMIPKYRFDEVSRKAKESEAMIGELSAKVNQLEEKDKRIKDLEAELASTKAGYETEKVTSQKTRIIKERLGNKVVDLDLVLTLIDLEKIELNSEGKIKGLSAQVKELQKSKPYLWKPAQKVTEAGAPAKAKTEKSFAQQLAENKVQQKAQAKKSKTYF